MESLRDAPAALSARRRDAGRRARASPALARRRGAARRALRCARGRRLAGGRRSRRLLRWRRRIALRSPCARAPGARRRRWPGLAASRCRGAARPARAATRLAAIDAGAFAGRTGAEATARGFVAARPAPRATASVAVRVETADGPAPRRGAGAGRRELPIGREVEADGHARASPGVPERGLPAAGCGIGEVLARRRASAHRRRRGGLAGARSTAFATGPRRRSSAACRTARRRSPAASSSARTIASTPRTVDDFKRSGLAHLLAVSGQNVILLALLAGAAAGAARPARSAARLAVVARR